MKKRNVKFSTLVKLILKKRPHSIIGIGMILFSLFGLIVVALVMSSMNDHPFESYDNEQILQEGTEMPATITSIKDVTNVTVNGDHPLIINYQYELNGERQSDMFQTFDRDKAANYTIGDTISIKSTGTQSVIVGMEPYSFPTWAMYLGPILFILIGGAFFMMALLPALKVYELYKNGIVKDAEVLAITRNSGLPITNIGNNILIDYHYLGRSGKKLFGSGTTTDVAALHESKAGSTIKIFVSETDEEKSTLIPRQESEKNNWNL